MNNCIQESVAADGPFVWVVNACEVKIGSTDSVFSSLLLRIDPATGERNLVTLAIPLKSGCGIGRDVASGMQIAASGS
jgi:hypothetical protein